MKEKNRAIEFYRFLFCCIVFMLHFRPYGEFASENGHFNGGYLSVEFFFIVSGVLMMKKLCGTENKKDTIGNPLSYLVGRYKKLYPYYLLSVILVLLVRKIVSPTLSIVQYALKGLPDILAIQIFWAPLRINTHLWFVSALLWASFVVYILLKLNKKVFLYIIEPVALTLFISFTFALYGHIDLTSSEVLWVSGIRAFVEIGLGCCVYELGQKVQSSKFNPVLCTILEALLLAVIIIAMYWTRRDYKDFVMIFLIAGFVFLVFWGNSFLSRALDNKISALLGSLSYVMYLNQRSVILLTEKLLPHYNFWLAAIMRIFILALLSWGEIVAIRKIRGIINQMRVRG